MEPHQWFPYSLIFIKNLSSGKSLKNPEIDITAEPPALGTHFMNSTGLLFSGITFDLVKSDSLLIFSGLACCAEKCSHPPVP